MSAPLLKEAITDAEEKGIALGHFNIANIEAFWAIVGAAKKLGAPVVIGLSEGERGFFGMRQAVLLVRALREEEGLPVYINADHTYSVEKCKEAIDAGCDSVIYDGAKLSVEENIENTKAVVAYAREQESLRQSRGDREATILVEGELGYIGSSSKVLDDIPEGVSRDEMTTPEDAQKFVKETGVDLFAPSVGNIHGMLRKVENPELDIERIKEVREAAGVPLVLHGGSGISDENFRQAIDAGISVVHINTEIRRAYRKAVERALVEKPDEIAPYRLMKPAVEAMGEVIEGRMKLFSNK